MDSKKVWIYLNHDGRILHLEEQQHALFYLLHKLGLKTVPHATMTLVMSTSLPPGTYTMSYNNSNGQTIAQTITVSGTVPTPKFQIKLPKEDKFLRPKVDRDQRRAWREVSKKHSRYTGRI